MAGDGKIIIALDAMGGDFAPQETVKGAVMAAEADRDIYIKLVGQENSIKAELEKYNTDCSRIEIINASEVIEMDESATKAIKEKKDSSMVKSLYLVKNKEADAFVTCGSTGACLVGGQVIVGRLKSIDRCALAFITPTTKGPAMIIDCGANVDASPENLVQYAKMGYIYMRDIVKIPNPRVGILNIGEEEKKGNSLVKNTFPLLKETKDINFIGSIESRGIPYGQADVVVCDAFSGNLVLKMYEGVSTALLEQMKSAMMSSLKAKIGGLLVKSAIKSEMKKYSVENYGGAPLLGLKGVVVKTHGSSKAIEVKNSILQCKSCIEAGVVEKISLYLTGEKYGV